VKVDFVGQPLTALNLLLTFRDEFDSIFVAPGLYEGEVCKLFRVLAGHEVVEVYLQSVGSIAPSDFARDPSKAAFVANAEEGFEPSCEELPLVIHILDMEVQESASIAAFDSKVKPSPEASVLVVRHRIGRHPNVELRTVTKRYLRGWVALLAHTGPCFRHRSCSLL